MVALRPFAETDYAFDPGINILSLPELQRRDPMWARRCWELEWQIVQDVPTSEPFTRELERNHYAPAGGS